MQIFRVWDSKRGFTVIPNDIFHERGITLKAKGLFCLMWSLPPDWQLCIAGLVALGKDGKDAITTAIAELENCKYMKRRRIRNESGVFVGSDYDLYPAPLTDFPALDNPPEDNPPQLNTIDNISSYKGSIRILPPDIPVSTMAKITPSKLSYGSFQNVFLKLDELIKLQERFSDWEARIENASTYLAAKGDKYKSHYAMIINWANRNPGTITPQKNSPLTEAEKFLKLAEELRNERG